MDHRLLYMDHRATARKSFPRSRVTAHWLATLKCVPSESHLYFSHLESCAHVYSVEKPGRSVKSVLPFHEESSCGHADLPLPSSKSRRLSVPDNLDSLAPRSVHCPTLDQTPYNHQKKEAFVRPVQTWTNEKGCNSVSDLRDPTFPPRSLSCPSSTFRKQNQVLGTIRKRTNSSVPVVRIKPMIRVAENSCDDTAKNGLVSAKNNSDSSITPVVGTQDLDDSHQKRKTLSQRSKTSAKLCAQVKPLTSKATRKCRRLSTQHLRCCTSQTVLGLHRTRPALTASCGVRLRYGRVQRVHAVKHMCYFDRVLLKRMKNGGIHKRTKKKAENKKVAAKKVWTRSSEKHRAESEPSKPSKRSERLGSSLAKVAVMSPNDTDLGKAGLGKCVDAGLSVPPGLDCVDGKHTALSEDNPRESDMPVLLPSFVVDCDEASVCSSPEMPTLTPFVDVGDETTQDGANPMFPPEINRKLELGSQVSFDFSDDSYVFPDEEDIPYFPTDSCDNMGDVYSPAAKSDSACLSWWVHGKEGACKRTARKSIARPLTSESVDTCGVKTMKRVMPERRARKSFCESCDEFHSVYRHAGHCAASEAVSPAGQSSNIVQYVNNPRYQPVVLLPKLSKEKNGSSDSEALLSPSPDNSSSDQWHRTNFRQHLDSSNSERQRGVPLQQRRRGSRITSSSRLVSRFSYSNDDVASELNHKLPRVDVIDGLEFLSFHTQDDLRDFVLRSGSRMDMSFRLSEDLSNYDFQESSMEPPGVYMDSSFDELDKSRKELIIPTKTKDITKIKGWKNKHFASKSSVPHLVESKTEGSPIARKDPKLKSQSPQNKRTNKSSVLNFSGKFPEIDNKESKMAFDVHLEETSNIEGSLSSPCLPDFISPAQKGECNVRSAFVSDILEDFLRTKSKLKIDFLSKCNPNINPPASDSKILSVGSLRKVDERDTLKRSYFVSNPPSDDDDMSVKKQKLSVQSLNRPFSDVKLENPKYHSTSKSLCDAPSCSRRSLAALGVGSHTSSWETLYSRSPSPAPASNQSSISEEVDMTDETSLAESQLSNVSVSNSKGGDDGTSFQEPGFFTAKKNLQLIRHTMWSKETNENSIDEFFSGVNCSSGEDLEKWRISTSSVGFVVRDISKGLAQHALSAMDSPLKPSVSVIQSGEPHKPVKLPPKCQFKSKLHSSNVRMMRDIKLPEPLKAQPPKDKTEVLISEEKENSSSPKPEVENGSNMEGLLSQSTRSKRSIRLPARYLDSALLVVGSEWVSPGPVADRRQETVKRLLQEKKNDESKKGDEKDTLRAVADGKHVFTSYQPLSSANSAGKDASLMGELEDLKVQKMSCARTSEYVCRLPFRKKALFTSDVVKIEKEEPLHTSVIPCEPRPETGNQHLISSLTDHNLVPDTPPSKPAPQQAPVTAESSTRSAIVSSLTHETAGKQVTPKLEPRSKGSDALCTNTASGSVEPIERSTMSFPCRTIVSGKNHIIHPSSILLNMATKTSETHVITSAAPGDEKPVGKLALLSSPPGTKLFQAPSEASSNPPSNPPPPSPFQKSPVKLNVIVGSKVVPVVIRNAIVAKSEASLKQIAASTNPTKHRILAPVILSPHGQVPAVTAPNLVRTEPGRKPIFSLNLLRTLPQGVASASSNTEPTVNPSALPQAIQNQPQQPPSENSNATLSEPSAMPSAVVRLGSSIGALSGSTAWSEFCRRSLASDKITVAPKHQAISNPSVADAMNSNCTPNTSSIVNSPARPFSPLPCSSQQSDEMCNELQLNHPATTGQSDCSQSDQCHPVNNDSKLHSPIKHTMDKTQNLNAMGVVETASVRTGQSCKEEAKAKDLVPQSDDVDVETIDSEFDPFKSFRKAPPPRKGIKSRRVSGTPKAKFKNHKSDPKSGFSSRSSSPVSSSNDTESTSSSQNPSHDKVYSERQRRWRLRLLCSVLSSACSTKFSKNPSTKEVLDKALKCITESREMEERLVREKCAHLAQNAKLKLEYSKKLGDNSSVPVPKKPCTPPKVETIPGRDWRLSMKGTFDAAQDAHKHPHQGILHQIFSSSQELSQHLPLSQLNSPDGKVILRFSGTNLSQERAMNKGDPQTAARSCPSMVPLSNFELNKISETTSKVLGPVMIKQVRLKSGKCLYTYLPCSRGNPPSTSSAIPKSIPVTNTKPRMDNQNDTFSVAATVVSERHEERKITPFSMNSGSWAGNRTNGNPSLPIDSSMTDCESAHATPLCNLGLLGGSSHTSPGNAYVGGENLYPPRSEVYPSGTNSHTSGTNSYTSSNAYIPDETSYTPNGNPYLPPGDLYPPPESAYTEGGSSYMATSNSYLPPGSSYTAGNPPTQRSSYPPCGNSYAPTRDSCTSNGGSYSSGGPSYPPNRNACPPGGSLYATGGSTYSGGAYTAMGKMSAISGNSATCELLRYLQQDNPQCENLGRTGESVLERTVPHPPSTNCIPMTSYTVPGNRIDGDIKQENRTSLWISDSGDPCFVQMLSPDEKSHSPPDKYVMPSKRIAPPVMNCSSVTDDEFLNPLPKCTVSSGAS